MDPIGILRVKETGNPLLFKKKILSDVIWKFFLEFNLETENFFFIFKALGDQILFVNRPDKKKILFFNDKSCQFSVDEGEPSFLDTFFKLQACYKFRMIKFILFIVQL